MAQDKQLPSTLEKSPAKARRTFKKTLESAEDQYGQGERASRTAYASLKHNFEKMGDHWEPKDEPGPSDPRSQQSSTQAKRQGKGQTYGGVDAKGRSKAQLYERAKDMDIEGRSGMSKQELARALDKANRRQTAKKR